MPLHAIILTGSILVFGAMLQSGVGFGYGLFAIPLLVWSGMPLPEAIALVTTATVSQSGWGCYRYRKHIAWGEALPIHITRLLGLPVGIWLLGLLVQFGQDSIKQVIGAVLLTVIVSQWLFRMQPRPRCHPAWGLIVGSTSGVLGGLTGMDGPPLVLWAMAHHWPAEKTRAFLWAVMLPMMPVLLAMLWWKFGSQILSATLLGLAFTPLVLLGSQVGINLGARLSRKRLRAATVALLVLIALSSIVSPLLSLNAG